MKILNHIILAAALLILPNAAKSETALWDIEPAAGAEYEINYTAKEPDINIKTVLEENFTFHPQELKYKETLVPEKNERFMVYFSIPLQQ